MNQIVKTGLSLIYPNSLIDVDHDLLACALSTYKGEPAISCILEPVLILAILMAKL